MYTAKKGELIVPTIYHLDEKEVHMVGEYAAVVWNTTIQTKTMTGEDGVKYRAEVHVRQKEDPYIDILEIRKDADGEPYEADDSPAEGGMDPAFAEKLAQELLRAAEYCRQIKS